MNDAELADVVRAVYDKVVRELPRVQFAPGTVLNYDSSERSDRAVVRLDGDPEADAVEVSSILTDSLAAGQRVLVVFDPPQGGYIIGTVSSQVRPFQTFHLEGPVTATSSPQWPVEFSTSLSRATARVSTVGSTDTTVDVQVDGTTIATLTIPAGDPAVAVVFATETVETESYVSVDVTAAGTGAADLVVSVY